MILEYPLMMREDHQTSPVLTLNGGTPNSINLTNQNKLNQPKFVSMTGKQNNRNLAREFEDENSMDDDFNTFKVNKNLHMPFRGKSGGGQRKKPLSNVVQNKK